MQRFRIGDVGLARQVAGAMIVRGFATRAEEQDSESFVIVDDDGEDALNYLYLVAPNAERVEHDPS